MPRTLVRGLAVPVNEFADFEPEYHPDPSRGRPWKARFLPGCFDRMLENGTDVCVQMQHDGLQLAGTHDGTLELFSRAPGLGFLCSAAWPTPLPLSFGISVGFHVQDYHLTEARACDMISI